MPLSSPAPAHDNRRRKSFVADLEQQIRTPMNTIIGLSSAEVSKGLTPEQTDAFQKINTAASSLMGILDNLLSVSKVEAGRLKINQEVFDVESVIADACDVNISKLDQKKVELIVNIDPRISAKLLGDGTQLWQILKKILENAADITSDGEIYLTATRKAQTPEQETLKFIVYTNVDPDKEKSVMRDCGIIPGDSGMPEMDPGITEIFQLVENNKGEIIFENTEAREVICIFVLSFARVAENIPSIGNFFASRFLHLRSKKALLLINRVPLAENLAAVLQIANISSQVVDNTADAVKILEIAAAARKMPDIIIIDLQLPDFNPDPLMTFFQQRQLPSPPCLIFAKPTNFERYEQRLKTMNITLANVGITDCLEKPATIQATLMRISLFLNKTRAVPAEAPAAVEVSPANPGTVGKIDWQTVAKFLKSFNHSEALQRLGNNYDLYGKMLADFYRNLEKEISEWKNITAAIDRNRLRISAHNIKSMAAYVGAEKLRETALSTELVCKNGIGDINQALRDFVTVCGSTLHILQTAHQASLTEPDNDAVLKNLYATLEFCEYNLSRKYGEKVQAGQKIWPENEVAALRQDINDFKFSEALLTLRNHGITEGSALPASDLPVILIIDDSPEAISILHGLFADECRFCATTSGQMALGWLEKFHADLILLDVVMPQMNGIKVYKKIRECPHAQNTPIIFISGVSELDVEKEVLNLGAADYILKPYNVATVQAKVHNQLALKKQHDNLTSTLKQQEAELTHTQEAIIHGMAHLAEYRESYTGQHLRHIKAYTEILAHKLRSLYPKLLNDWDVYYQAALSPVHDIGKVGIRDNILKKMGPLTEEEYLEMKRHTIYGADVIKRTREDLGISNVVMEVACQIVTSHHERYDGSGYPYGLKGEEIPLAARIVALADIYDALTSVRPYKPAFTHERTVEIITKGDERTRPEHFDPQVLAAFMAAQKEFSQVVNQQ